MSNPPTLVAKLSRHGFALCAWLLLCIGLAGAFAGAADGQPGLSTGIECLAGPQRVPEAASESTNSVPSFATPAFAHTDLLATGYGEGEDPQADTPAYRLHPHSLDHLQIRPGTTSHATARTPHRGQGPPVLLG